MNNGIVIVVLQIFYICLCEELKCEDPWELVHRNCVIFIKNPLSTWKEAQETCEDLGGNLISVNSYREKKKLQWALKDKIKKSTELSWWVGLHHKRNETKWEWLDGSSLSLRSRPWAPGQPDNYYGNEICASFHFSGKLYDERCETLKPFVCQRIKITPAPKTTTTTTFSTLTSTQSTMKSTEPTILETTELETTINEQLTTHGPSTIDGKKHHQTTKRTDGDVSTAKEESTTMSTRTDFLGHKDMSDKIKCKGKTVYGITWPDTTENKLVKQSCQNGQGFAIWPCNPSKGWLNQPDMRQCSSTAIQNINKMLDHVRQDKEATSDDMLSIVANLTERIVAVDDISVADISASTSILHQVAKIKPKTPKEADIFIKEMVKSGTYLVRKTETSKLIDNQDKPRATSSLLYVIEDTAHKMVENLRTTTTISTKTEKIYAYISVLNISTAKKDIEYHSSDDETNFIIPYDAVRRHKMDGLIKVVFMTHYDLGKNLPAVQASKEVEVASNVITASLGQGISELSVPVTFTIPLLQNFGEAAQPLCSFWNFSKGDYGQWSQEGCHPIASNSSHVTCQCNHLTNFAVLMDVTGIKLTHEHQKFLEYITYIGCIISITCLALSWITFQCCRSLDGERNSIHKNLVFCLFWAELIFIVGIDRTAYNERIWCAAIALLLHFLFLSSFMWMFLEGVHIVVLLQQVFDTAKNYMKYYYLVGYGIPITIVATTAGIDVTAYGTPQYCWLTTENWFIWSFTGPVAVILIINTIVLMYALSLVCRHSAFIFARDKTQHSNFRAWVQGAIAMEVLLGTTWVFGYFFIDQSTVVMAYTFTVLNSIQGLFIFVFHCLLNKKIRFEYKKLALVRHNSQSSTKSASFKKKDGSYEVYVST